MFPSDAWLVRWTLKDSPRLLPWDMFTTIPEQAFELVEPLHGEPVFFVRLDDDQELAVRSCGLTPEQYTCWVTAGRKWDAVAVDSNGRIHSWRLVAHAESIERCLANVQDLVRYGHVHTPLSCQPLSPSGIQGPNGPMIP